MFGTVQDETFRNLNEALGGDLHYAPDDFHYRGKREVSEAEDMTAVADSIVRDFLETKKLVMEGYGEVLDTQSKEVEDTRRRGTSHFEDFEDEEGVVVEDEDDVIF